MRVFEKTSLGGEQCSSTSGLNQYALLFLVTSMGLVMRVN
nr:MAG TPA_asm: hypothetical protein [Caudoviricetes sp.]